MGSSASTLAETQAVLKTLLGSYQTHGATVALLPALSAAMHGLQIPMHSRSYRRGFSENYIMLLGHGTYRPEILSAAISQEPELWVNGQVHQLSPGALGKGMVLKNCFLEVCSILAEATRQQGRFPFSRLRAALAAFESIWVQFEEVYISELIRIEDLSKRPLLEAVALEFQLLDLEFAADACILQPNPAADLVENLSNNPDDSSNTEVSLPKSRQSSTSDCAPCNSCDLQPPTLTSARRVAQLAPTDIAHLAVSACSAARGTKRRQVLELLVLQAASLNSCANSRSKGRNDMTVEVLEAAADLHLCDEDATDKVRETLASSVLDGFLELRHYFHKVSRQMLWIDPQLANNSELQKSLASWENAWELGNDFLVKPDMRNAFCGISLEAASIQEFQPRFAQLLEEQDAELFLILPRVVLLSGLCRPELRALAESFGECGELGDELRSLSSLFPGDQLTLWQLLVAKAMQGPGAEPEEGDFAMRLEKLECFDRSAAHHRQSLLRILFLLELEGLSMQLQRREPQRWNRCCQLLLCAIRAAATPVVLSL